MATNVSAPFGFRQFSGRGSAPTYEQVAVSIDYNATNIFYGDPVVLQADGNELPTEQLPLNQALAAGKRVTGIVMGIAGGIL